MGEITYRLARDEDRVQIISLLNDVFSAQQRSDRVRDDNSWNWKNKENVFEDTLIVVAVHENEVIGTGTLWPFRFNLNGNDHLAYQTCALAVSPDFRRRGVFRNINRVRIETARNKKASFLFSFPNSKSLPGYKKMGWALLGKLRWFVKPLKPLQVVSDLLLQKNTSAPFQPKDSLLLKENQIQYTKLRLNDGMLRLDKDKKYFDWRYARHPYFHYGFIPYEEDNDYTYGAVFSLLVKGKYKEMVIIDMISKDSDMTWSIIRKTEKIAKQHRAMYLALLAPSKFSHLKMLTRGYVSYRMKNFTVYTLDSSIRDTVENLNCWSLFAGLHDSI